MKTFELNGVTYNAKPFSFNMICDLEDYGVSIESAIKKPMVLFRVYVAVCLDVSIDEAGNIIEKHLINGGDLATSIQVMTEELSNSDFFQSLNKGTKKKTTKATSK